MSVTAEIITIGDEILYGQTLDTNSHWISQKLDEINIKVVQKTTIGDHREQILDAFSQAESRVQVVLITGGLGPTKDDLTKPLFAEYFGVELGLNEDALNEIQLMFNRTGREMTILNQKQAELPLGCTRISNQMGTASGMLMERNGTTYISMPGVPYEMRNMMELSVIPILQARFTHGQIYHKIIRTIGIAESTLADKIKDWESDLPKSLKLAYLPSPGQLKLRLTGIGQSLEQLRQSTDLQIKKVLPTIGKYVYGFDQDEIEGVIGGQLIRKNKTIATAESCTGGKVASMITSVPGSSVYFKGSIIAYSNDVKTNQLNIPASVLNKYGAVSEEVIKLMAENVCKILKTDFGLATSGIAGPEGGSPEKPVGTVWVACSDGTNTFAKKLNLTKDRNLNIKFSTMGVLNLFRLKFLS